MRTNAFIQLALLCAILFLIYAIVEASRQPASEVWQLDFEPGAVAPAASEASPDADGVTTEVAALASEGDGAPKDDEPAVTIKTPDLFPNMRDSLVFKTIIDKPTPKPRPTRKPRTPKPPPDIKKVLDSEGWRLADVYKGKATIERKKKKAWINDMKVGDAHTITYARKPCEIKLIAVDEKNYKITLGYGDQRYELSMF